MTSATSKELRAAQLGVLRELERANNLTAESVVEHARDPASPLHAAFEWDVAKAAAAHWIETARGIITSYKVVVIVHDETYRAPVFVRDPDRAPAEQGYIAVKRAADEETAARGLLSAEIGRALSLLTRARAIAAQVGLIDEFDELLLRMQSVREKAANPYEPPTPTLPPKSTLRTDPAQWKRPKGGRDSRAA